MALFIRFMLAVALWPLLAQSTIVTLMVLSMLMYVPRIHARYGWHTRLWGLLALALVLQALGTYLVMQGPVVDLGRFWAATPVATVGMLLSSGSLLAWVVGAELDARLERQRIEELLETGENLDDFLGGGLAA